MKVAICVNMPGYLPDSETYPYHFEGDTEDTVEAIFDEYCFQLPEESEELIPFQEIRKDVDLLVEGLSAAFSYDLPESSYVLEVILIER